MSYAWYVLSSAIPAALLITMVWGALVALTMISVGLAGLKDQFVQFTSQPEGWDVWFFSSDESDEIQSDFQSDFNAWFEEVAANLLDDNGGWTKAPVTLTAGWDQVSGLTRCPGFDPQFRDSLE